MKYVALVFILIISLTARARTKARRAGEQTSVCERYIDSLAVRRAEIDSLAALEPAVSNEPRYMRLFAPLAFHTDIARRRFAPDSRNAGARGAYRNVDDALINVYINRPDLVRAYTNDAPNAGEPAITPERKVVLPALTDALDAPAIADQDFAPVDMLIEKPDFWTFAGDFYLSAVQNYYSANWYQGLESNYSWLAKVTLQANYNNKQKITWDNKLEMNIGFQTDKGDEVHKIRTSEDLLRYTTTVGLQATKRWYYTFQTIAYTQFLHTYPANSAEISSSFLSPLNINASVGMSYKFSLANDRLTGSVYFSPAALGVKYVGRKELAAANGISEGKHSLVDFGYTFTVEGTWKFNDYISWATRLYGYSPYDRVELQFENTLTVKVSKIIAVTIYAYPRFDDSARDLHDRSFGYFQLKEYTSLGLTYSL